MSLHTTFQSLYAKLVNEGSDLLILPAAQWPWGWLNL